MHWQVNTLSMARNYMRMDSFDEDSSEITSKWQMFQCTSNVSYKGHVAHSFDAVLGIEHTFQFIRSLMSCFCHAHKIRFVINFLYLGCVQWFLAALATITMAINTWNVDNGLRNPKFIAMPISTNEKGKRRYNAILYLWIVKPQELLHHHEECDNIIENVGHADSFSLYEQFCT